MSTYVMGDIHGEYEMFLDLLEKIKLAETDTLYVMGDMIDRGEHPMKVLLKLMEMPNAFCLLGNHEMMALECLPFLQREITDQSLAEMEPHFLGNLAAWMQNGGETTINEFRELSPDMREAVMDFLQDLLIYVQLRAGGQEYLLVHAGLGHFAPEKNIEDYSLQELVWERADYARTYYPDRVVITGHTPTWSIEGNPEPGSVYRANHHIAVDCGAGFPDGKLAAVCLETGEVFYAEKTDS